MSFAEDAFMFRRHPSKQPEFRLSRIGVTVMDGAGKSPSGSHPGRSFALQATVSVLRFSCQKTKA